VTDKAGLFSLRIGSDNKVRSFIYAPKEKLAFSERTLKIDNKKEEPLIIPFERMILNKLDILVVDSCGRPVSNADIKLSYRSAHNSIDTNAFTQINGKASLIIFSTEPTDACLTIRHPDFGLIKSGPFRVDYQNIFMNGEALDLGEDVDLTFTLQRGVLLQNIRVVDGAGNPMESVCVEANLESEDGTLIHQYGLTNFNGTCDISFPQFKNGVMMVSGRPDTKIHIDYDLVLKGRSITLVRQDSINPACMIKGKVVDEAGRPAESALVLPTVMEGQQHDTPWALNTDKNGRFSFPAFADRIYQVSVEPYKKYEQWYWCEPLSNIVAGSNLKIRMKSTNSIKVNFKELREEVGYRKEINAWLEGEKGQRIQPAWVHPSMFNMLFLGVPDGTIRAVLCTQEGKRFKTDWFNVDKVSIIQTQIEEE
jgi:hypothetical protein